MARQISSRIEKENAQVYKKSKDIQDKKVELLLRNNWEQEKLVKIENLNNQFPYNQQISSTLVSDSILGHSEGINSYQLAKEKRKSKKEEIKEEKENWKHQKLLEKQRFLLAIQRNKIEKDQQFLKKEMKSEIKREVRDTYTLKLHPNSNKNYEHLLNCPKKVISRDQFVVFNNCSSENTNRDINDHKVAVQNRTHTLKKSMDRVRKIINKNLEKNKNEKEENDTRAYNDALTRQEKIRTNLNKLSKNIKNNATTDPVTHPHQSQYLHDMCDISLNKANKKVQNSHLLCLPVSTPQMKAIKLDITNPDAHTQTDDYKDHINLFPNQAECSYHLSNELCINKNTSTNNIDTHSIAVSSILPDNQIESNSNSPINNSINDSSVNSVSINDSSVNSDYTKQYTNYSTYEEFIETENLKLNEQHNKYVTSILNLRKKITEAFSSSSHSSNDSQLLISNEVSNLNTAKALDLSESNNTNRTYTPNFDNTIQSISTLTTDISSILD